MSIDSFAPSNSILNGSTGPTANKQDAIHFIACELDIPSYAYEKVEARYKSLRRWLLRAESSCRAYGPYVFPQGSFLLGTVNRPVGWREEYDLDIGCRLDKGVSRSSHSQEDLKRLIGGELEAYREAEGIEEEMEEKRRCWRLYYQDKLPFHMDVVPCIPAEVERFEVIKSKMLERGADSALAEEVAALTVSITDTGHDDYSVVSPAWPISNPQGYGLWFRSRVLLARETIKNRLLLEKKERVEELPTYRLKAPLQLTIQLLKRHRDVMFREAPDHQPISVIITTLAAEAYEGEEDLTAALLNILAAMDKHVNPRIPRVPNPVNPAEDFADKWYTDEGQKLDLAGNFRRWLDEARRDFNYLAESRDAVGVSKRLATALGIETNAERLQKELGLTTVPATRPTRHRIKDQPKPWSAPLEATE